MNAPRASDWSLLSALSLLWGSSFLLIAIALDSLSPISLVGVRVMLATLLLLAIGLARGVRLPRDASAWLRAAFMALAGTIVPFFLISWGQQYVDSAVAALLLALMPLVTTVLAALFLGEQTLGPRKWLGLALGLCGVAMVVNVFETPSSTSLLGAVAILIAAVCYAGNTIFARRFAHGEPLQLTATVMVCATFMLLPFSAETPQTLAQASGAALMAACALGVLSTALATLLYFRLVQGPGPTFVANVNYLIPLWAVLFGVIVLGEAFTLERALGMALIIGGVVVSEWRTRRAATRASPASAS